MTSAALTLSRRNEARGFTLTELAIVLGVIGIILGVIWVAAGAVYENNRTARAGAQVMQIIGGYKSIYGGKRVDIADWTDITAMTINNQFMPADMIQNGVTSVGYGPWGNSAVNVISHQSWNGIIIEYSGLAQSACNHFANAVATSNPGLIWVDINGQQRALPPIGAGTILTTTDVNTYCNQATGNYVYVMYSMN